MKIIEYSEDFGEICFDEGFEQKIYGKTIEEQIKHYRIRMKTTVKKYSYGELDNRRSREKMMELTDCDDVKGLIIKNGLLVGVELKNYSGRTEYCFPGQSVTVYFASDDDGVGSTDREDVACLVCI